MLAVVPFFLLASSVVTAVPLARRYGTLKSVAQFFEERLIRIP
jgi:hypothetical protein